MKHKKRLPVFWSAVFLPTATVRDFKRRRDLAAFLAKHPRYRGCRLVRLPSGDYEPTDY